MLRDIYLEGEMGDKFGSTWRLDAATVSEALRGIECNVAGFRQYIVDCIDTGVNFHIEVAGRELEDPEELLVKMNEGDIIVTPIPAGSKSGGAKILAAIAIGVLTWGIGMAAAAGAIGTTSAAGVTTVAGVSVSTIASVGYGIAINLALSGIQQLMAPDPATEREQDESYLFTGSEQNIAEGDPVPLLYGELRVPGRPISFEVLNEEFLSSNTSDTLDLYNIGDF